MGHDGNKKRGRFSCTVLHELHEKKERSVYNMRVWGKREKNKILNLLVYLSTNSGRILNGWDG